MEILTIQKFSDSISNRHSALASASAANSSPTQRKVQGGPKATYQS